MNSAATITPAYQTVDSKLSEMITSNHIDVPMLPEVAGKVVRLTQDPESDASDLAKLIQSDQTLAGHVMRVANSAAYTPNSSMVSLQQAITRLGMKLISEIALAASVNSSLFNTPGYDAHIQYILRFSLASSLWAKEIARSCRKNVEAAFLTGLLHDIGRPVAVQNSLEIAQQLGLELSKKEVFALEQKHQRAIGIKVIQQWEMPAVVTAVVEHFDNYEEPHDHQDQTMITVAGAEFAEHMMCEEGETVCTSDEELMAMPVLADLNLYQDEVVALLDKTERVKSAMEAMVS
ncbi:HDOD domain-containing protein [Teredinibacter waterburyi]|jgi:Predicted signal transduction protein|uniref:HDOD domain-containing protein n=1 Tax=Teredinibacter waterburyi TaxID=1500538 RepID=UPI00165FCD72|nr:HDOD domain-containing protein [Teredinibacter waterburyi]